MTRRNATGATVYLQEELSNARLYCDELKNLVTRALKLISASPQRDHFYSVAGDIIHGAPNAIARLDSALNASALAVNKLDYEELRVLIRPEKVDELERVLEDVRLRIPRRTGRDIK
jgi:hypothetical protein